MQTLICSYLPILPEGTCPCVGTKSVPVRKTYKYRLYESGNNCHLKQQIDIAGIIWNHALALQKRYYRLIKKYIPVGEMKAHLAKLRMRRLKFAYWKKLNSQTVQELCERQDEAYQHFFNKRAKHPPKFKKIKKFKSFVLKTSGWKLIRYNEHILKPNQKYARARGMIEIGGKRFKFVQHRPLQGTVKTACIKRDSCGRLWVCFNVQEMLEIPNAVSTGRIGGFDFGLKTFLTDHAGTAYLNPQFFAAVLHRVRRLSRAVSHKIENSHNQDKARWLLNRTHIRVTDKRQDFHYQLAHHLCDCFDTLVFEDLNLAAMKRFWGRKVSDLAFGQFVDILTWVAFKRGKTVVFVPRFERTTGLCSRCKHKQEMTLRQRTFQCERCGLTLDRDHNAAINIQRIGASIHTSRGSVSPDLSGTPA